MRAEWTKLRSLRLPVIAVLATIIGTVAASWVLTTLIDAAIRTGRPEETAGLEPGSAFLVILHYGQIGPVLIATWIVHQEAEPGSLRSTLLSVPRRGFVLVAKATVLVLVVTATGATAVIGSAAVRCLAIDCGARGAAFAPTLAAEVALLLGVAAYWTLIALLSFALAIVLRSGLVAMCIALALPLGVSGYLLQITPLARFLPDQAGSQLYQPPPVPDGDFGPLHGGLIVFAWILAATTVAIPAFHRQPVRH